MTKQQLKGKKCKKYLKLIKGGRLNPRVCELEQLSSGWRIKASTITNFCAKANETKDPNFTKVLDDVCPSYRGWYKPSYLSQSLKLKDVYGNNYNLSVRQALKNKYLGSQTISALLRGEVRQGLDKQSANLNKFILPNPYSSIKYTIENINGQIRVGETIRELANKTNLAEITIAKLIHGISSQTRKG